MIVYTYKGENSKGYDKRVRLTQDSLDQLRLSIALSAMPAINVISKEKAARKEFI